MHLRITYVAVCTLLIAIAIGVFAVQLHNQHPWMYPASLAAALSVVVGGIRVISDMIKTTNDLLRANLEQEKLRLEVNKAQRDETTATSSIQIATFEQTLQYGSISTALPKKTAIRTAFVIALAAVFLSLQTLLFDRDTSIAVSPPPTVAIPKPEAPTQDLAKAIQEGSLTAPPDLVKPRPRPPTHNHPADLGNLLDGRPDGLFPAGGGTGVAIFNDFEPFALRQQTGNHYICSNMATMQRSFFLTLDVSGSRNLVDKILISSLDNSPLPANFVASSLFIVQFPKDSPEAGTAALFIQASASHQPDIVANRQPEMRNQDLEAVVGRDIKPEERILQVLIPKMLGPKTKFACSATYGSIDP